MTKTGTAIERSPEQLPGDPSSGAMSVDVVPVELVESPEVALARQARARRVEVANRVLSLLGSLGNLALRFIELRRPSSHMPVDSAVSARPAAQRAVLPEPVARRESRAASTPRSGDRGRRQRRRHRGAG